MAQCPKCGGGAYLVDEEFVKVLENTEPMKIVIRAIYQCRSCSDRFSRIMHDLLEARRKQDDSSPYQQYTPEPAGTASAGTSEPVEGIKFLDNV